MLNLICLFHKVYFKTFQGYIRQEIQHGLFRSRDVVIPTGVGTWVQLAGCRDEPVVLPVWLLGIRAEAFSLISL